MSKRRKRPSDLIGGVRKESDRLTWEVVRAAERLHREEEGRKQAYTREEREWRTRNIDFARARIHEYMRRYALALFKEEGPKAFDPTLLHNPTGAPSSLALPAEVREVWLASWPKVREWYEAKKAAAVEVVPPGDQ